jgi:hypothetical protein
VRHLGIDYRWKLIKRRIERGAALGDVDNQIRVHTKGGGYKPPRIMVDDRRMHKVRGTVYTVLYSLTVHVLLPVFDSINQFFYSVTLDFT